MSPRESNDRMPTFPELTRKPTPQRRIALAPILSPGRNSFPTLANCIAHSTGSAFDDVIGSIPLRTEAHRTFSAVKKAMINTAKESSFMKVRLGDFVGMQNQDDLDLCEMINCPRRPPGTEDPDMVHIFCRRRSLENICRPTASR